MWVMIMTTPTQTTREIRTFSFDFRVEKREDEARKIVGHAAVFNKIDGPEWFREQIAPGAFADSIKDDDVRALFNHDPNFVLGRNRAGTLELREDKTGLHMEIDCPNTQVARDLLTSIERGDVDQASFAFQAIDAAWDTVDGEEVRTLKKVRLFDVSPVTFPFYEATDVSLRKQQWEEKQKEPEPKPNRTNVRRKQLDLKHGK